MSDVVNRCEDVWNRTTGWLAEEDQRGSSTSLPAAGDDELRSGVPDVDHQHDPGLHDHGPEDERVIEQDGGGAGGLEGAGEQESAALASRADDEALDVAVSAEPTSAVDLDGGDGDQTGVVDLAVAVSAEPTSAVDLDGDDGDQTGDLDVAVRAEPTSAVDPDSGDGSSTSGDVDVSGVTPNLIAEPTSGSARYNRSLAVGFVVSTMLLSVLGAAVMLAMRHTPHTADQDRSTHPSTQVSVVAAPTAAAAVNGGQDAPIPYTATSVGCLPGSTTAQSVAGTDPTQAWVCVHGGTVGQHLVLDLGRTWVITGVSIAPGWVGADPSGADQWLQHQVVKRLQWSFNDTPPTVIPQDTRSVHGDAPQTLPGRGVLASRIIVLVLETGRAPADTAPSTPAPAPGGLLGDILGPTATATPTSTAAIPGLPADQSRTDPADNTFAVSSIKIYGHPPQ